MTRPRLMTGIDDLAKADLPGLIHGSAVSIGSNGVLILGPSGSGKSSLALNLMAFGASLISDDIVRITSEAGGLTVSRPPNAKSPVQIEARGFGLLSAQPGESAKLVLAVDMSRPETERLPEPRKLVCDGCAVRVVQKIETTAFPAMILQYLKEK